jgi:hypothetical protein
VHAVRLATSSWRNHLLDQILQQALGVEMTRKSNLASPQQKEFVLFRLSDARSRTSGDHRFDVLIDPSPQRSAFSKSGVIHCELLRKQYAVKAFAQSH